MILVKSPGTDKGISSSYNCMGMDIIKPDHISIGVGIGMIDSHHIVIGIGMVLSFESYSQCINVNNY